jgi:hypothetical protein
VYGSIHSCVDFLFLARVIFVSFANYFARFSCAACSFDSEHLCLDFFVGSLIDVLCMFVLDALILNPQTLDLASDSRISVRTLAFVTEPPKIIPYYCLSRSTWPLSNNKELFCHFRRVKPGESLTTGSRYALSPHEGGTRVQHYIT